MPNVLNDAINNFSAPEEQWGAHVLVPVGDTGIGVTPAVSTADTGNSADDSYAIGAQVGDFQTGVSATTSGSSEGAHSDLFSTLGLDSSHAVDLGHFDGLHL